jgi:hypothetical protein
MKFYKNNLNRVFAFAADGSQDHLISSDLIEISIDQMEILTTPVLNASELNARNNMLIQSQIDSLEKGQARAVREATLGIDGAMDRLKALNLKIRSLAEGFVK